MVFGRRAFFGAHPTPDGDVVWFVNEPRAAISADERRRPRAWQWLQRWPTWPARRRTLRRADRAGELELAADNTHDLGHVPRWHRGRLVVLGDAAHAPRRARARARRWLSRTPWCSRRRCATPHVPAGWPPSRPRGAGGWRRSCRRRPVEQLQDRGAGGPGPPGRRPAAGLPPRRHRPVPGVDVRPPGQPGPDRLAISALRLARASASQRSRAAGVPNSAGCRAGRPGRRASGAEVGVGDGA